MWHNMKLVALFLLIGVAVSSPFEKRQAIPAGCTNITIPVPVYTANNLILPLDLDTANFLLLADPLIANVFRQITSGGFDISATYCEPVVQVPGRENTLQILVHGITYTKAYWFGLYYDARYSWVSYASSQGYPTLTIDRLGNGESSHPDPILDVQTPLQVEVLHQIILQARNNQLPVAGRAFTNIIVAGHSFGSIIANSLNWEYPADADATLLTGYGPVLAFNLIGFSVQSGLFPASLEDPRFAGLALGYLEASSYSDVEWLFYTPGEYDQGLANLDWATRGTVTLGEAATGATGSQTASEYTGPVFVITGLHDSVFCSTLTLNLPIFTTPTCYTGPGGLVPSTQRLYSNAKNFSLYFPQAGHCWHLHYAAENTFGVAHQWMADQGF